MSVYCIADEDTVRGFRLAGFAGHAVTTVAEAAAALDLAVADPGCDLIVLSEPVAAGIRPQVDRIRLERERPLLSELPAAAGTAGHRASLRRLAQEAVGIRLGDGEER